VVFKNEAKLRKRTRQGGRKGDSKERERERERKKRKYLY